MQNINNFFNIANCLSTFAKHSQFSFRFRLSGWPAAASIASVCAAGTILGGLAIKGHTSANKKKDLDLPKKNDPDLF